MFSRVVLVIHFLPNTRFHIVINVSFNIKNIEMDQKLENCSEFRNESEGIVVLAVGFLFFSFLFQSLK